MSSIATPQVAFTPEFLAFAQAALDLNAAQSAVHPAIAAPVKPTVNKISADMPITAPAKDSAPAKRGDLGDLGFGFKKDGTPRKKANPVWLRNVKPDAAPVAIAPVEPIQTKPAPKPSKTADQPAWMSAPAIQGSDQHIRILASEIVVYGLKSKKLTKYIVAKFATKGAASAHYKTTLAPKVNAKGADIRHNSPNWKLAAAIIAKLPVA